MNSMVAALTQLIAFQFHLPACSNYFVPPTAIERASDAALVQAAAGHQTTPDKIVAVSKWRVIWGAPANSEPAVFFFRVFKTHSRLRDVWSAVITASERNAAVEWAANKVEVPRALAHCFAGRLLEGGP